MEHIFHSNEQGVPYSNMKWNIEIDFVGPSSNTLQIQNIQSIDTNSILPNIRNNYTVTDKADGDRKLLFISKIGRIYLIDTNMQIQFTGAQTNVSEIFETIN